MSKILKNIDRRLHSLERKTEGRVESINNRIKRIREKIHPVICGVEDYKESVISSLMFELGVLVSDRCPEREVWDYDEIKNSDIGFDTDIDIEKLEDYLNKALNRSSILKNEYNIDNMNEQLRLNGTKWGIALPGGSFLGTLSAGYMFALRDTGLNVDTMIGTSAGAWSMLAYAYTDSWKRLLEGSMKVFSHNPFVLNNLMKPNRMHPSNFMTERLFLATHESIDLEYSKGLDANLFINYTNADKERRVVDLSTMDDKDEVMRYALASSANPVISSAYVKNGNGRLYDGWFNDSKNIANIEYLLDSGIDKVVALVFHKEHLDILKRRYDNLFIIDFSPFTKYSGFYYDLDSALDNIAIHGPKEFDHNFHDMYRFLLGEDKTKKV